MPPVNAPRISRRMVRPLRQIGLLLASTLLVLGIASLIDREPAGQLSLATAYAGLFFLAVTLALGPINLLRGVANPAVGSRPSRTLDASGRARPHSLPWDTGGHF